jgi:bacterioferritin-associated ferredoxin
VQKTYLPLAKQPAFMVVFYERHFAEDFDNCPATCGDQMVCHCLQVTESSLQEAMQRCPLESLRDIANETGAGTGCTACHRRLRRFLSGDHSSNSCSPIWSVK